MDTDRLRHRRQFVLGPYCLEECRSWKNQRISDSMVLMVHPDLPLLQVQREGMASTLLGYLLDPDNPHDDDLDILKRLMGTNAEISEILAQTHTLGGRWIIIVAKDTDIVLFNDATGLRQVFFTDTSCKDMWCASQPRLLAKELNLTVDDEARQFMDSQEYRQNKDHWWPTDTSPYRQIKHLTPNYYLDLKSRTCHRYWPNRHLGTLSLQEGTREGARVLHGLMESAMNRFPLALAITCGWDTRLLLAASREFSKDIFYYTLVYRNLTADSADIAIPSKLLSHLNLKHHVFRCPSAMRDAFRDIYRQNVVEAHEDYGMINQGLLEFFPPDRVSAKGIISSQVVKQLGVISGRYYAITQRVNGTILSHIVKMKANPFMVKHFDRWLGEVKPVCEKYNLNIIELFGWEQITANWQAMAQLEFDISQETFAPFNCRALLAALLSVDGKYRELPSFTLYLEIIKELWPEVLHQPIKPLPLSHRAKCMTVKTLMHLQMFKTVEFCLRTYRP